MGKIDVFGGQAVIEGVMMKSSNQYAIAVRTQDGKIKIKKEKHSSITSKHKFLGMPFVRGVIILFEMMIIGIKALSWSANQQGEEEEELTKGEMILSLGLAILFSIIIFIAAPFFLTKLLQPQNGFWFNVIDGIFRILLFVGYVAAISLMRDVQRLFQYHGAEHKIVLCHEAKKKLTPENAQKFPTLHPRCGTSFLIFVIILSILVFSIVSDTRWWVNLLARFLFIPIIAGISYELLRFSARHQDNFLVWLLIQPGLWMQRLTTKEPTIDQLEVAIAALNAAKE